MPATRRKTTRQFDVNGATVRHEQFEGHDQLVVPVVAVREGVLNGMLLLFDEFSAYPSAWEGIPLPINHPRKGNLPVTANTPDVLESSVIGRFFNVEVDKTQKALKGELWIDTVKAQTITDGPEIIMRLESGEKLEVSTAYFADIEDKAGVFAGERYNGIQRNLRPDHLALLPHSVGACSWDDGCGAPRVAERQHTEKIFANTVDETNDRNATRFTLNAVTAAISHDETARMIRMALDNEDPGYHHWLADVFDDFVVYEKEPRQPNPAVPAPTVGMFKRNYSIAAEKVTLGDVAQVRRRMSYIEIPANNAQDKQLKEAEVMDKKPIVDALITDERTPWKEEHRVTLMTLAECELNKLKPAAAPAATAGNVEDPTKKAAPKTGKEWLDSIPDEGIRTMIQKGIATHDAAKAGLIKELTANKSCAFIKEELEGMELDYLEKVANMLGVNYAGAAAPRMGDRGAAIVGNDGDGVPEPPKILTAPVQASADKK